MVTRLRRDTKITFSNKSQYMIFQSNVTIFYLYSMKKQFRVCNNVLDGIIFTCQLNYSKNINEKS